MLPALVHARRVRLPALLASSLLVPAGTLGACADTTAAAGPDGEASTASDDGGEANADGGSSPADAGATDDGGPAAPDGRGGADGGSEAAAPGVLLIGRFDASDGMGPRTAWPGGRILARFDGTSASVTLSHMNGSDSLANGGTWINVIVDGVVQAPRAVTGASQVVDLTPGGVAPGVHSVEIEKRTEANLGTLRFEGFSFAGGAGLLPPPPRPTRRIEFISESTIDGFGVDGAGPNDPATCNGGAPGAYNDARKSLAFHTASALSAEHHLIAFSGKGVSRNNDGTTTNTMASLWTKTLPEPESQASPWAFGTWTPDVIVLSLGGADHVNGGNDSPVTFQAAYAGLVADIRARYGATPHVWLTVWSQLKDYNGVRSVVTTALDGVVAARPNGERTYRFVFPEAQEAVETGCYYHASDAHHRAMAALLVAEIEAKTGW